MKFATGECASRESDGVVAAFHEPLGKRRRELWDVREFVPIRVSGRIEVTPRHMVGVIMQRQVADQSTIFQRLTEEEEVAWWDGYQPLITLGGDTGALNGDVYVCKHCHLLYFVGEAS